MVEWLLPFLLGGGLLALGILQHGRRLRGWQEAAATCGLEVRGAAFWKQQLTASSGPLEVKIEACGNKGQLTRIIVGIPGPPGFSGVSIRRESLLRRADEIETGDSSFDRTFLLKGPMPQVLALLDAEMRRLLIEVNTIGELELFASELRVTGLPDDMVPYVLRLLLDIGRRLLQPVDIPRRLAENARRDPEAGVRLRAARELGPEGRGVLLHLAESLKDDAVSAEAVAALAPELPVERTQAILDRALEERRLQTARACLEALGQSGDAAAEAVLLPALQSEQADLRIAAAAALGRVGSVEAVLPLKEAAERSWLDLELRRAARQAVAEIQARLQGATPGQLSLAGAGDAGQLSLAQDPAGQLSVAQHEASDPLPSRREREAGGGQRG